MSRFTPARVLVLAAIGAAHLTLLLELQLSTEGMSLGGGWLELLRTVRSVGIAAGLTGALMVIGHGVWDVRPGIRGFLVFACVVGGLAMVGLGAPMTMIVIEGGGTLADVLPGWLHWPVALLSVAALDIDALAVLVLCRGEGSMREELADANDTMERMARERMELEGELLRARASRPAGSHKPTKHRPRPTRSRATHSTQDRAAVVARAEEIGIRPAAREAGVGHSTVSRWIKSNEGDTT